MILNTYYTDYFVRREGVFVLNIVYFSPTFPQMVLFRYCIAWLQGWQKLRNSLTRGDKIRALFEAR